MPVSPHYSYKLNYNKTISEFFGIIEGIIADGIVVQQEAEYLLAWMSRNEIIFNYEPALKLYDDLTTYLSDGYLDDNERQKLTFLIGNYNMFEPAHGDVTHLLGLCKGIVADKRVKAIEAQKLFRFLRIQNACHDQFPFNAMYYRLLRYIMKIDLSDNDLDEIISHIEDFTGEPAGVINLYKDLSSKLPLDQPAPPVLFKGQKYCLTGIFMTGSRAECEAMLEEREAVIQNNVTLKTDYLIIGLVESPDWKFGNYGTKVSQAIDYKQNRGQLINIISESYWLKHMPI